MGSGPVRIRPLREDELTACARLIAGDPLWQRYRVTVPRARRTLRQVLTAMRRGGAVARQAGEFAVAHLHGEVVGFIWFRLNGTFHHSGYIRWIGVAPQAQGRGVGRRLMAYAERKIFAAGPNSFLMVSSFNRAAQAFYRTLGYRRVGVIPDYVVRGITELVYRKTRGPIARRGEREGRV